MNCLFLIVSAQAADNVLQDAVPKVVVLAAVAPKDAVPKVVEIIIEPPTEPEDAVPKVVEIFIEPPTEPVLAAVAPSKPDEEESKEPSIPDSDGKPDEEESKEPSIPDSDADVCKDTDTPVVECLQKYSTSNVFTKMGSDWTDADYSTCAKVKKLNYCESRKEVHTHCCKKTCGTHSSCVSPPKPPVDVLVHVESGATEPSTLPGGVIEVTEAPLALPGGDIEGPPATFLAAEETDTDTETPDDPSGSGAFKNGLSATVFAVLLLLL